MIVNYFFLFSVTLFGIAGTILALFNYNPYQADPSVFGYFYGSLFVALAGILSFVIYFIKLKIFSEKGYIQFFWPSVRQATFVSTGIVLLLLLKGFKLLDWWVGLPTVIAVILLELFFQTSNKQLKEKPKKASKILKQSTN